MDDRTKEMLEEVVNKNLEATTMEASGSDLEAVTFKQALMAMKVLTEIEKMEADRHNADEQHRIDELKIRLDHESKLAEIKTVEAKNKTEDRKVSLEFDAQMAKINAEERSAWEDREIKKYELKQVSADAKRTLILNITDILLKTVVKEFIDYKVRDYFADKVVALESSNPPTYIPSKSIKDWFRWS